MVKHDTIISKIIIDTIKNERCIGLFIFGSVATNQHNERSDIDICVVLDDCQENLEQRECDGVVAEIHYRPIRSLLHAISLEVDWVLAQLRECRIVHDPLGILKSLVLICKNFSFSQRSIDEDMRLAWESYESALDMVENDDIISSNICIRYATDKLVMGFLKNNNVFYKGPKYLSTQIEFLSEKIHSQYCDINNLSIDRSDIKKKIENFKNLYDQIKKGKLPNRARELP